MAFEKQRLHLSAIILYFIFIQQYGPKRVFRYLVLKEKKGKSTKYVTVYFYLKLMLFLPYEIISQPVRISGLFTSLKQI